MTAQPKGWTSAHDATVPSAPDARAIAELAAVTKTLGTVEKVLPRAFHILRDAQTGSPGAASYDTVGRSGGTRTHCWNHGQDHGQCQAQRRDPDPDRPLIGDCRPETLPVNDPTGEAALQGDRAAHSQQEIRRSITRLLSEARKLTDLIEDAAPRQRPPTDKDRRTTAADNTPGCAVCAQVEVKLGSGVMTWSPVSRPEANPGGNLPDPIDMCETCYQRTRKAGHAPTKAERTHLRDFGKWPRATADA